ncbi:hypothetical protein C8T65DRAFT_693727 [Cerioporus squamosus]|nr:hypothetical protein C8T65DRAFT_693727 [Cerioporus squamosus]
MSLTDLLPPGLSISQAIQYFYQAVGDTFAVNLAAGAASTWIAYDICLTFAQEVSCKTFVPCSTALRHSYPEVELVWKAKWSLPKVMYFAVRYYGLAASLLYFLVRNMMDDPLPSQLELLATLCAVVTGRGMKHLIQFLDTTGSAELTSSITVGTIEARTISVMPRPPGFPRALPGCYTLASVPLRNTLGAWIVNCSVATIFFALMLYRFVTSESFRLELSNVRGNPLAKWFELRHFSPLLYLLLRDGVVYFAMIFFVNALNMALSIRMEGRALEGMGIAWTIAVSSVASSRLLLNLRGFIGGDRDERSGSLKTTMRFEHPLTAATGSAVSRGTAEDWIEMKEERPAAVAVAERDSECEA